MASVPRPPETSDPVKPADTTDPLKQGPAWDRMESQRRWYSDKSTFNKRWYMSLKIVQLVCAALVPVMASVHAAVWVTGGFGAIVVVVEGIQQLGQYQANWISYRSTSEALGVEKALYLADAGPYTGVPQPTRMLAERVETLLSKEHATWTAGRDQVLKHDQQQRPGPADQHGQGGDQVTKAGEVKQIATGGEELQAIQGGPQ